MATNTLVSEEGTCFHQPVSVIDSNVQLGVKFSCRMCIPSQSEGYLRQSLNSDATLFLHEA